MVEKYKIAIVYSTQNPSKDMLAKKLYDLLTTHYDFCNPEDADTIICLGGDGFMLHTIHNYNHFNVGFYGINCGNLGFLMNEHNELLKIASTPNRNNVVYEKEQVELLLKKVTEAQSYLFHPLSASINHIDGSTTNAFAFNEVSLLRNSGVACNLQVYINDILKLKKLVSDGILLSTPLGSTAYNRACGGAPLPLSSHFFALTAINCFSPLSFKGAVIQDDSIVKIQISDYNFRPVNLFCDFIKYENIKEVTLSKLNQKTITLLFDNNNLIMQKALNAQFFH